MPIIKFEDYKPALPFRNGHVSTIYPVYMRKQKHPGYDRVRISTPDDDFLDLDFIKSGSKKVVLLCHGLEGSSNSQYILALSKLLAGNGYDVAAINYRGCSGEMNLQPSMYHSGATYDLHTAINFLGKDYQQIDLVGFSLGGNLTLKYLGENTAKVNKKINKAIAVSVPLDLEKASIQIGKWYNWQYDKNFRDHLIQKIKAKNKINPELSLKDIGKVKTLYDFDNFYTAPYHGFKDAEDYYEQSKSIQFLSNIKHNTLIINALDDPFLPKECYPFELLKEHPNVWFGAPKYGGHVGFVDYGKEFYWIEKKILWFLETEINKKEPSTIADSSFSL